MQFSSKVIISALSLTSCVAALPAAVEKRNVAIEERVTSPITVASIQVIVNPAVAKVTADLAIINNAAAQVSSDASTTAQLSLIVPVKTNAQDIVTTLTAAAKALAASLQPGPPPTGLNDADIAALTALITSVKILALSIQSTIAAVKTQLTADTYAAVAAELTAVEATLCHLLSLWWSTPRLLKLPPLDLQRILLQR